MLDTWIIEELRRKEEEREDRPALELPLYPTYQEPQTSESPTETERGIIIIEL